SLDAYVRRATRLCSSRSLNIRIGMMTGTSGSSCPTNSHWRSCAVQPMLVAAAVVCLRGVTTMKSKLGAAFPTALRPRDRRTEPARQRTHIRLHGRVDRLEDAISHFYNVINE